MGAGYPIHSAGFLGVLGNVLLGAPQLQEEYEALYGRKPQSRRERKRIQKAIRNARLIDDRRFN